MFYAHIVLAKKGPFARIWLAAHWDKKLTKAHVFETNIEQSVEGIMQPKVKLALRTSGHLLLGVVRIYSRKAKYLLADCNEAFVKIKMAFRPGMVDLPEEHREAAVNAITLPEVFHDFDTALPELNDVDIEAQFSINQSRADEITMREEYGSLPMSIHDEGFGDMGFDDADFIRDDPAIDENMMAEEMEHDMVDKEPMPGTSRSILDALDPHGLGDNDGFGDGDGFGQPAAGLFEGDLFADAPLEPPPPPIDSLQDNDSDDDMDGGWVGGPPSTAPSSPLASRPASPVVTAKVTTAAEPTEPAPNVPAYMSGVEMVSNENDMNAMNQENAGADENLAEQTNLLNNEEESFALAPVDASALKGVTKAKRKRKLIVDEVKNISGEEMKSQLANTSDIITTLDLAPPTKRLMYWKDTGGVEKMFALCSRDIKARILFKSNQRHFVSRSFGLEDFSMLGPSEVLALEQHQQDQQEPLSNRRGRKRKLPLPAAEPELPPIAEASVIRDGSAMADTVHSLGIMENLPVDDSLLPPSHELHGLPPSTHLESPNRNVMLASPTANIPPMSPASGSLSLGGGRTPADLSHGRMTPLNLGYGGGGVTPMQLHHGGMTPGYSGDFGPADLQNPAYTPGFSSHGGITPHHGIMENIDSIPNLPADQVSSILNGTGLENIGYSNMGYDEAAAMGAGSLTSPRGTGVGGASERVPADFDDYDFPQSVGAHQPGDEQMENETDEQFEERVLNKRAAQMFVAVRSRMTKKDSLFLSEMTFKNTRKQAAQKFYSLLVLKKFQALDIKQEETYGDILVTKGIMFDNPKL